MRVDNFYRLVLNTPYYARGHGVSVRRSRPNGQLYARVHTIDCTRLYRDVDHLLVNNRMDEQLVAAVRPALQLVGDEAGLLVDPVLLVVDLVTEGAELLDGEFCEFGNRDLLHHQHGCDPFSILALVSKPKPLGARV